MCQWNRAHSINNPLVLSYVSGVSICELHDSCKIQISAFLGLALLNPITPGDYAAKIDTTRIP